MRHINQAVGALALCLGRARDIHVAGACATARRFRYLGGRLRVFTVVGLPTVEGFGIQRQRYTMRCWRPKEGAAK